jgi:hypothetical protein
MGDKSLMNADKEELELEIQQLKALLLQYLPTHSGQHWGPKDYWACDECCLRSVLQGEKISKARKKALRIEFSSNEVKNYLNRHLGIEH